MDAIPSHVNQDFMANSNHTKRTDNVSGNKWIVLAVMSVGNLMITVDAGMLGISYPALADALNTDTSTVLWVNVAFWVTSIGLLLPLGWLGDVAGRRRVFTIGFIVFTIGIIIAAGTFNVWQLICARIFQGIGSSMILSNLNAFITSSFKPGERGKAMGISGAVVGIGLSTGPLAGGFLLDVLDWRSLFYSRVPLGILGIILGWSLLPRDRILQTQFKLDLIGTTVLFCTLGSFLLVINRGGALGFGSPVTLIFLTTTCVLVPALVWVEKKSVRPIVASSLLKNRQYRIGLLVLISHYLSHGPILLIAPFFFIESLAFSATKMGLFVGSFFIARTILAPIAGRLSDLFGPKPFLLIGNALIAVALLSLSTLGIDSPEWSILAMMIVAGGGSAFFEPVVTSVIMGSVPQDRLGTASAAVATGRHLGFAVGVALAGAIYTVRQRVYINGLDTQGIEIGRASAEAIASAFGDALLAASVLAMIAAVFSFNARNQSQRIP